MAVPISQMWTVATYVLKKRLTGKKRYPLVLMLEPLFRCNLACAGCGKVSAPSKNAAFPWSPSPAASRSCIRKSLRSSTAS